MRRVASLGLTLFVAGHAALIAKEAQAQWQVGAVDSHVEGTVGKAMWTKAIAAQWRDHSIDLTLSVQCVKNSTTVLMRSKSTLVASSDNTVAWALDGGPVQRGRWDRTSDFSGVGLWQGSGIPFAKSLVGGALLKVSIIPANGAQIDATFLVANAEPGLKEVGRQCGWQPPEAKQVTRGVVPPKVPDTWSTVSEGSKLSPTKDGYVWRNGNRIGWVDQRSLTYYRLDQLEAPGGTPKPLSGAAGERFVVGALEAAVEKSGGGGGQQANSPPAQKVESIQKVEKTADGFVWSSGRRIGWVDAATSMYYRLDRVTLRGEERPTPLAGKDGVKVVGNNLLEAARKADAQAP